MVKEYSYSERKKENALFNDALNTFYIRLYGVTHMVKEHSYSERKEIFYLRLYGVGHMVKEHSYSERRKENALFNDALNTFY